MFMNVINCLCHLINIDTFAASTDVNFCYTRELCTFKFLVIKFKKHSYGRRYYNDNYSVLEFWPTLSGNVILKGMFRTLLKVPVLSCCFTVDSCHKTLMSGEKES